MLKVGKAGIQGQTYVHLDFREREKGVLLKDQRCPFGKSHERQRRQEKNPWLNLPPCTAAALVKEDSSPHARACAGFRALAALNAAMPVAARPVTNTLTSYVPSYV